MAEALSQISWNCPTCRKTGRVDCDVLIPSAYDTMAMVKKSHKTASPDCIVSYPNFGSPHAPRKEEEAPLPQVYNIIMTSEEAFLVTMCLYVGQCLATGVTPYPSAIEGTKHWMDVVGDDRVHALSEKFQKIAHIENMNTVLHVVYKDG